MKNYVRSLLTLLVESVREIDENFYYSEEALPNNRSGRAFVTKIQTRMQWNLESTEMVKIG